MAAGQFAGADDALRAIDPDRPIVDSHHHLWAKAEGVYLSPEAFAAAFDSEHNVVASVYVECGAMWRKDGPAALRPVGEAEFAREVAAMGARGELMPRNICAAFVGAADFMLGEAFDEVLAALNNASGGRLRGIRGAAVWDADPKVNTGTRPFAPKGMLLDSRFRAAFAYLQRQNLVYDAWQYFHQLPDVADLAASFPNTIVVVNHCGGVLRIGPHAVPDNFGQWRTNVAGIARRENVRMKLGGLAGRRCGFAFEDRGSPASASELAALWRPYVETCIELFGADRCMFESNFPPDMVAGRYGDIWNAFKLITAECSTAEKDALFSETARRTYRIS